MKVLAFPKSVNQANPYTSLLYGEIERQGVEVKEFDLATCNDVNVDVLHVHWPEWFLGRRNPIAVANNYWAWMDRLRTANHKGTKIVWTVHNFRSHERRHEWLQKRFWREFRSLVDGCVCLSESSRLELLKADKGAGYLSTVIPHGHYREAYPMKTTREAARQKFSIDGGAFTITHVGLMREYKNVPTLIQSFYQTKGIDRLIVAGEVFDPQVRRRVEAAMGDPRASIKFKHVADDDMQFYYRAADLAVFPYREILNSGSAMTALSFDVPVLVPGIGSMPELRDMVGRDWVMTYQGDLSSSVLEEAKAWVVGTRREKKAPLDKFAWPGIASKTIEFYKELLAR